MWRSSHSWRRSASRELVRESIKFLKGRAPEVYQSRGQVPAWAFISCLAHSDADRLLEFARPGQHGDSASWNATIAYLATEIIAVGRESSPLETIQREVLIPVELDLLAGTIPLPTSPVDLVGLVVGALDEYRVRRRG